MRPILAGALLLVGDGLAEAGRSGEVSSPSTPLTGAH